MMVQESGSVAGRIARGGYVRVRLLGPVDVVIAGAPVRMSGLRRKAVLAVLALHGDAIASSDHIMDAVWGDAAISVSVNTLQSHVSHLRHALDDRTAIVARPPGYQLRLGAADTDVGVATALVERGVAQADPRQRVATLGAALAMWRGSALMDVREVPWLAEQAGHLERLRRRARRALADARLTLGQHALAETELAQMATAWPLDEQVHGQWMFALYRTGRQAEALGVYRALRRTLADSLGIDPNPGLRDLEAAILRQDPALQSYPLVPSALRAGNS